MIENKLLLKRPITMPAGVEVGFSVYPVRAHSSLTGLTGPWKPVSGEGRARRGLSVIVVKKIDVNVNSTGILGIYGHIDRNERS